MRSSETETSDQQTFHAWVSSYSSGSSVDQPSASVAFTTESYLESSKALSFFVRRRSGDFLSFREGEACSGSAGGDRSACSGEPTAAASSGSSKSDVAPPQPPSQRTICKRLQS